MRNKIERFDSFLENLGSVLLLVISVLLLLLATVLMINAFRDLHRTNQRIASAMEAASLHLTRDAKGDLSQIGLSDRMYLERLQTSCKNALDSNTISFLFQMFTLSLVSAGVYLLSRSRRNLRRAEAVTRRMTRLGKRIGPFVANGTFSSALGTHFIVALQESRRLKSARTQKERTLLMPNIFETLTQLLRHLNGGRENSAGVERSQHDIFLDQACEIERNLTGIPNGGELLRLSRDCQKILRGGELATRYERYLKGISRPS